MATYEVTSPDGVTLELEGDNPPTEAELNQIFSSYQEQEKPGIMEGIGNMFTGADRETRATQELPELESALVGGLSPSSSRVTPSGLVTS